VISRGVADAVALLAFIVLLVAGINVMAADGPEFGTPEKHVTVIETSNGPGTGKRSDSVSHEPGEGTPVNKTSKTFEHEHGKPSRTKTETNEEGERSFVERVLGKTGLIALQVAIVVLAAFLGAALLQRALLGDFSIKVGNLIELGQVKEAVNDNTSILTAEVKDTADKTKAQEAVLDGVTKKVAKDEAVLAVVTRDVFQLKDEVKGLRAKPRSSPKRTTKK
jgi:hypothetical protein